AAAVKKLRIKVSGCFNACAQHHLADLGFFGVSRKHGSELVPCFQVVLGGELANNAGAFGLAIGAVPSKHIPQVVERITQLFARDRNALESFRAFVDRVGKSALKTAIQDLTLVPDDASFFFDHGDARKYSMDDHRGGEGAGQSLSPVALGL